MPAPHGPGASAPPPAPDPTDAPRGSGPRVSILVPNLDQARFLPARFASLEAQEFGDWEAVVSDNFSTDGSWDVIRRWAEGRPRVRAFQSPREGMYANWNRCLAAARGELVCIAPADDLLRPDGLRRLVAALDAHPDCDLADSQFAAVEEDGLTPRPEPEIDRRERALLGPWYDRPHVRRAPGDVPVITHLTLLHRSITQVLVRRRLFDRIGPFRTDLGSDADWEWHLRASFVADKAFVPAPLSQWRRWGGQATRDAVLATGAHAARKARMVDLALAALARRGLARDQPFSRTELLSTLRREEAWLAARLEGRPGRALRVLLRHPRTAADALREVLGRRHDPVARVRALLVRHGLPTSPEPWPAGLPPP